MTTFSRMIGTSLVGAALLMVPAIAGAQPRPQGQPAQGEHRGGRHGHGRGGQMMQRLERMAERLGLSEAQRTQVRAIVADARTRAQAMRQQTEERTPARREARRELFEQTKQRVLQVLTPAQRAQFEQIRAQRREHMRECRERFDGERGHGPRGRGQGQGRGAHGDGGVRKARK